MRACVREDAGRDALEAVSPQRFGCVGRWEGMDRQDARDARGLEEPAGEVDAVASSRPLCPSISSNPGVFGVLAVSFPHPGPEVARAYPTNPVPWRATGAALASAAPWFVGWSIPDECGV